MGEQRVGRRRFQGVEREIRGKRGGEIDRSREKRKMNGRI